MFLTSVQQCMSFPTGVMEMTTVKSLIYEDFLEDKSFFFNYLNHLSFTLFFIYLCLFAFLLFDHDPNPKQAGKVALKYQQRTRKIRKETCFYDFFTESSK